MSGQNENPTLEGKGEKPKVYDGSKKPMIRVDQYHSSRAVENARNRIGTRLGWIKTRSANIQKEYGSSGTAYHIKQSLLEENETLAKEVPIQKKNLNALDSKFNELEDQVKKEIQGKTLKPIEIG